MAAPSKSWVTITDAQVDADSPLDTTLVTALRDDLVHLEEWLGDGYTAAKDHDHDGVNSKTLSSPPTSLTYGTIGDNLLKSADTERTQVNAPYTKVKEIYIAKNGILRIKFDLKSSDASGTVYGRIYRNGTAIGTERSNSSLSYVTYSEDISGWTAGDLCQLYLNGYAAGRTAYGRNFRFYTTINYEVTTVITD